jgi:hypothetical protein
MDQGAIINDDQQQGGSMLEDHVLVLELQADLDGEDACSALYLTAELDHSEAFVHLTVQQQDTITNGVKGDNQDSSEIMAVDHVNNDGDDDQQGESMLDDRDRAIKLQADLDGEVSLQEARLNAERGILTTSTGKASNSESMTVDNASNRDLALKLQADLDGDVSLQKARLNAERSMLTTSTDKAWNSEIMTVDHANNDQQGGSMINDHALVLKLQADLDGEVSLQEARPPVEISMLNTAVGKAWKFVEQVLHVHDIVQASSTSSSCGDQTMDKSKISIVAVDDMVLMAERLLAAQERFRTYNKPTHVDIGYHYTQAGNMDRIEMHGLLTRSEREANQIYTRSNGASLGDGVYTGTNPFAFHKFAQGDVGILVARLKGQSGTLTDQDGVDTAVSNPGTFSEIVVPGSSCQCVALVSFSSSLIDGMATTPGSDLIHKYHCQLQEVIDEILNGDKATEVPKVSAPSLPPAFGAFGSGLSALVPLRPARPTAQGSSARSNLKIGMQVQPMITVTPFGAPYGLRGRPAPLSGHPPYNKRQCRNQTKPTPGFSFSPAIAPPTVWGHVNHTVLPYLPPAGAAAGTGAYPALVPPLPAVPVPSRPSPSLVSAAILYTAPHAFNACSTTDSTFAELKRPLSECSICLHGVYASQGVVSLTVCGHEFHKACIGTALQFSKRCPVCRKWVGSKPQGTMPTGTMKIRQDPTITCSGYDPGAIVIDYSLGCNVQKVYHPNPGTTHGSAYRRAFLPDNTDGRNLLKRLEYAFRHGLTFCVGTSLTTGVPNVITWSSIHHKTRLAHGPHGFPDLGYFINSNDELDALGVPAADNL